ADAKSTGQPVPAAPPPAAADTTPAQAPATAPPAAAPEPEPQRQTEQTQAPPRAPETPRVNVGDLAAPGAGVVPPQLVSFPKPAYPPMARTLRAEGVVVVSVLVDENGQVQEVKMAE